MTNFKAKIFTLFPDLFPGYLDFSILGDAKRRGLWELEIINIRDFAIDKHKTVDDTPFGGGAGMVLKADVVAAALDQKIERSKTRLIYPSPRGALFNQKKARELANSNCLAIICGRYEGIDQRLLDEYQIEEISLGDFVLSGGELPAMTILDAVLRNLTGVLGEKKSLDEESFGDGNGGDFDYLLEYPHYTKPAIWRGREVPEILLSGHHKKIKEWRLQEAINITKKHRPDLYNLYRNLYTKATCNQNK